MVNGRWLWEQFGHPFLFRRFGDQGSFHASSQSPKNDLLSERPGRGEVTTFIANILLITTGVWRQLDIISSSWPCLTRVRRVKRFWQPHHNGAVQFQWKIEKHALCFLRKVPESVTVCRLCELFWGACSSSYRTGTHPIPTVRRQGFRSRSSLAYDLPSFSPAVPGHLSDFHW